VGECEDQEAGEAKGEILALPIPNIYWAQMPTSCVNYLNLSALVFLVQKFHKQGTNNYQLINPVVSINTCKLYG